MTSWVISLLVAGLTGTTSASNTRLTEVAAWKTLSFQVGNKSVSGAELPYMYTMGLDRWFNKLFITTPRFTAESPSTLNYIRIDKLKDSQSPDLIPYPSLEANTVDSKAWPPRLVSVWRIRVDVCDRLWVVDSGKISYPHGAVHQVPPRILVYDLETDELLFFFMLKDFNKKSFFPSVTVDVTSANCDHAFAYLPDPDNNNLIVYNLYTNSSHTLTHNYFHFDPLAGDFNYGGHSWQMQGGIYTLALSPMDLQGNRIVYFQAQTSTMAFITTTKVLQNTNLTREQRINSFSLLGNRGSRGQSSSSFIDEETGVLFYTLVNRHGVGCWNSFKDENYDPSTQGTVAEDEDSLNWPSDVKVDKPGNLWVLTSSMTDLYFNRLDTYIINYRIFTSPVRHAIKGTVCDDS